MLKVKTPEEVLSYINNEFSPLSELIEYVPLSKAAGRSLGADIAASEYVPDFDRSTVDGYALRAADTFGCTTAIPAILPVHGRVLMGEGTEPLPKGCCRPIPTGGELPDGADCAVMIEYTEDYGDGTVGILKSAAPGQNIIFRGDDVSPGKPLFNAGHIINARDTGALAALGITNVPVKRRLKTAVISTGDELVSPNEAPMAGQVRDVNAPMLCAMAEEYGAEAIPLGIIRDDEALLTAAVKNAVNSADIVLLSGGSSVGERDAAGRVIQALGELLIHGIAMKPGKPTILGRIGGKPIIGLPGHPVAAYFVTRLFLPPLIAALTGAGRKEYTVPARLSESVGANHGRAQYCCCRLEKTQGGLTAHPIRTKSGLITTLAGADGFFFIDRDCEGLPKGAEIQVYID